MNHDETFSNSIYVDQVHQAERELSAFLGAVTKLFGPEEARVSAEDWLDESELMDSAPRSESRDWRAITVAASARLANRVNATFQHGQSPVPAADKKLSPILSSNYLDSMLRARRSSEPS